MPIGACVAAALGLVGCRTAGRAVRAAVVVTETTAKVAVGTVKVAAGTAETAVHVAAAIIKDFDYYAKKAHILRGQHDSRPFKTGDVIAVLGRMGGRRGRKGAAHGKTPALPNYPGPYRWPLHAGVVSSEFGARWGKKHEGIDIAADTGEPVLAAADGVVVYAGHGMRGYGNAVILRHDEKTTTLYAHNSALKVKEGEGVRSGQVIALLGSTGHSTGPHVHFEIRSGQAPVNPRRRLPKTRF